MTGRLNSNTGHDALYMSVKRLETIYRVAVDVSGEVRRLVMGVPSMGIRPVTHGRFLLLMLGSDGRMPSNITS